MYKKQIVFLYYFVFICHSSAHGLEDFFDPLSEDPTRSCCSSIDSSSDMEHSPTSSISLELGNFNHLPLEIIQQIVSSSPIQIKDLNKSFHFLITGEETASFGVTQPPKSNFFKENSNWQIEGKDFTFDDFTPETIPTYVWFHLLKDVNHLPEPFWDFIKGTKIKRVNLENNELNKENTLRFLSKLKGTSVEEVKLNGHGLGDDGVSALGNMLKELSLKSIYLGQNNITPKGVEALAKELPGTSINTLNLAFNRIKNKGLMAITKAIPLSNIMSLNLSYNLIDDHGALSIAQILKDIKRPCTIIIRGNSISKETQLSLKDTNTKISWEF